MARRTGSHIMRLGAICLVVLFIAMAETAVGLGQGVFEAWLRANPGREALFLHTTRYRVGSGCFFKRALRLLGGTHFRQTSHLRLSMLLLTRVRGAPELARQTVDDAIESPNHCCPRMRY